MADAAFDVFARLLLDTSSFSSGLTKAKSMASSVGGAVTSGFAKLAKATTVALTATSAAVTAFTKGAVQTGLSFDAAIGEVAATAGKSAEELAQTTGEVETSFGHFEGTLRDFAKFMGKNTAFTATQAAQALNYMALAGYETQESMEMLPTVLNMAAAGSMDLARASDMITDTQKALGLTFERTGLMVDEFAKAAATGNTTVEMLGEAFLTVGGLGRELNKGFVTLADGTKTEVDNIQQLEIAFTAMANAGIKGSEAGTHMRNMLLKLANPTSDGAKALEKMNVAVFNAKGEMNSLDQIFSQLNKSFKKMTQAEKLATIGDLFNARDTASAEALLSAIEEDWDKIGQSILKAEGSAAKMAETKLDNLSGQITKMKSALEGAKIALSDKLTPSLKDLAKWGTEAISKLTSAFEEGGAEGLVSSFGELLSEALTKGVEKLPKLTSIAGKLLGALGQGIMDNIDIVADAATQVLSQIVSTVFSAAPKLLTMVGTVAGKVGQWIMDNSGMILNGIENLVNVLVDFISNNAGAFIRGIMQLRVKLVKRLPDILKPIAKALPSIIKDIADALVDTLPELIAGITQLIYELIPYLPDILTAIAIALPKILVTVFHAIVKSLPQLLAAVITLVEGLIQNLPEILSGVVNAVFEVLQDIIGLIFPFAHNFMDVFEGFDFGGFIGGVLGEAIDIAKGIFEFFGTLMDDPAQAIKDAITGIKDFAVETFEAIKNIITGMFELIEAKKEEAEAKKRAEELAEKRKDLMATGNYDLDVYEQVVNGWRTESKPNAELDVKGSIEIKGVNNENEFIGAAEMTEEQLARMMQREGRLY